MHMRRISRVVGSTLCIVLPLAACGPRYQPRHVPVPSTCEPLLQQATADGLSSLDEAELRQLAFCQEQQLLRAEEEQAAFARFEAGRRESGQWFTLISLILTAITLAATDTR